MPKRLCWVRLRLMWEEAQQHILLNRAASTDDGGYHAVNQQLNPSCRPGAISWNRSWHCLLRVTGQRRM